MSPLAIYQDALNVVSQAVLAGDFDSYAAKIDLPYLVHTDQADLLATRPEDLQPTFETLTRGLKARGVTHYERVARTAGFAAPDRIEGWHHTHLIADGSFVELSRRSGHVLVRRGERWQFSEAFYQIDATAWPLSESTLFASPAPRDATECPL